MEINVGTIADNNYTQHTGVMLFSLLKNCSSPQKVHIYIMDGGIEDQGKETLRKLVSEFGAKIDFIVPRIDVFKGLKIGSHLTPIIYAKLLFGELEGKKRFIVMDSDIIVEGDIKELFETDLKGKVLGAVADPSEELQVLAKKNLGLGQDQEYFNSGVMVVDCVKWKKQRVLKKVLDYINTNSERIYVQDQDGMNGVLKDDWQPVAYEWNLSHPFFYKSLYLKKKFGKERLNEMINHPKIIHFTIKPWKYDKVHPLTHRYWHYLRQTPWKDFKYPDRTFKNFLLKSFRYALRPIHWETKIRMKEFFSSFMPKKEKQFYYVNGNKTDNKK